MPDLMYRLLDDPEIQRRIRRRALGLDTGTGPDDIFAGSQPRRFESDRVPGIPALRKPELFTPAGAPTSDRAGYDFSEIADANVNKSPEALARADAPPRDNLRDAITRAALAMSQGQVEPDDTGARILQGLSRGFSTGQGIEEARTREEEERAREKAEREEELRQRLEETIRQQAYEGQINQRESREEDERHRRDRQEELADMEAEIARRAAVDTREFEQRKTLQQMDAEAIAQRQRESDERQAAGREGGSTEEDREDPRRAERRAAIIREKVARAPTTKLEQAIVDALADGRNARQIEQIFTDAAKRAPTERNQQQLERVRFYLKRSVLDPDRPRSE